MFNKAQLIERGKGYFDNKDVKAMHATSDGQFFHETFKEDAEAHAHSTKGEVFEITRDDVEGSVKEAPLEEVEEVSVEETSSEEVTTEPTEEDFEALKEEWDDLSGGKTLNKRIKYSTLLEKVEALR